VPFLPTVRKRNGPIELVQVGDLKAPTSHTHLQKGQYGASSLGDAPCEARLLTKLAAARFLKVSVNTVDRLRYQRTLPYYRLGGTVRFSPWDLLEFMSGNPVLPEQVLENADRTLTKAELAAFLGLSSRSVEHLVRHHGLWRRQVGRSVRFFLGDVLLQLQDEFRVAARESA
jgi:excisionase family DNA binding protein